MHTCTHARMHARTHTHTHARTRAHMHARTRARMHTYTHAHMHVRTHTCMYVCTCARTGTPASPGPNRPFAMSTARAAPSLTLRWVAGGKESKQSLTSPPVIPVLKTLHRPKAFISYPEILFISYPEGRAPSPSIATITAR